MLRNMLRNIFRKKPATLTGAPAIRRLKSYAARSGYVYQYYYEGHRTFSSGESGTEFVFTLSADRQSFHPVSVFLAASALSPWEEAHAHPLGSTERYAIAKMALFQAFDERDHPAGMKLGVHVRPADVDALIETLGL